MLSCSCQFPYSLFIKLTSEVGKHFIEKLLCVGKFNILMGGQAVLESSDFFLQGKTLKPGMFYLGHTVFPHSFAPSPCDLSP